MIRGGTALDAALDLVRGAICLLLQETVRSATKFALGEGLPHVFLLTAIH